jgi:hypothetical protein
MKATFDRKQEARLKRISHKIGCLVVAVILKSEIQLIEIKSFWERDGMERHFGSIRREIDSAGLESLLDLDEGLAAIIE